MSQGEESRAGRSSWRRRARHLKVSRASSSSCRVWQEVQPRLQKSLAGRESSANVISRSQELENPQILRIPGRLVHWRGRGRV